MYRETPMRNAIRRTELSTEVKGVRYNLPKEMRGKEPMGLLEIMEGPC